MRVDDWTKLIESADPAEQSRAAHALRAGAGSLDLQAARRALAAPGENARKLAVWVIGGAPPHQAIELLQAALADPSAIVRLTAVLALSGFRSGEALEQLARAADDREDRVALAAITAMLSFGDSAIPTLAAIARSHRDDQRRASALSQLGALAKPNHTAVAAVALENLQHAAAMVREAACRALSAAGDRSTLPVLRARLTDPQEEVRRRAAEAVRAIEARS